MKIVANTNEVPSQAKAELMEYHNKFGWLVFSPTENITDQDIPDEAVEFEGQQTYSQRLYNVLFRVHEAQGGKEEDFPMYRAKIMESLIKKYKAKIDDFKN